MSKQHYDASSIENLTFVEGVRKRVGMYLGSADNQGAINGLLEVVNNSLDENIMGYGEKIEIKFGKNWYSVRDYGRGIPVGPNNKVKDVLVDMMTTSHSGGKFKDDFYTRVRGLNGVGGSASCASADYYQVRSYKDGFEYQLELKKGIPTTPVSVKIGPTKETGTYVYCMPSPEVFSTEALEFEKGRILALIKEYAYFSPTCRFDISYFTEDKKEEKTSFFYPNGIMDFARDYISKAVHPTYIYQKMEVNNVEFELICQWTTGKESWHIFVNGGECPEGGTPVTGLKTSITREVNKDLKIQVDGDLIRKGLNVIISIKHPLPIFANQTKTKISNAELRGMASQAFSEAWKEFRSVNRPEFDNVIKMIEKVNKAEQAADKAREAILTHVVEMNNEVKKQEILIDKLSDAEFLGESSILCITEGDSAATAANKGRDTKMYGVLAIRGKIINSFTNSLEDVLENKEIKTIIYASGINIQNYKRSKLRYGKIAIFTDSDSDGYNIGLLIMTFFQKFAPDFIKEGRLCWLRAPLFRIVKNGKNHFYFSDEELAAAVVKGGEQSRFKGIGEMSNSDMKEVIFNQKNQRMDTIKYSEDGATTLFDLMGPNVQPRKDFVFSRIDFEKYGEIT